jgi:ribosomal protein S18 acetylase RimI-like enzyme
MPERQAPAIQFYRKFGFYTIAPYREHPEPGILCMEKRLT